MLAQSVRRLAQKAGLPDEDFELIVKLVHQLEESKIGYGFCLSDDRGDRLSQWRGYADDGNGFSIGFSKSYFDEFLGTDDLRKLSREPRLCQVLYTEKAHDNVTEPALKDAIEALSQYRKELPTMGGSEEYKSGAREARVNRRIHQLTPQLYALKSHAFQEEEEWRLISQALVVANVTSPRLPCRAARSRLIPFQELSIDPAKKPIVNIFRGPKNSTPLNVIEAFLAGEDFFGVTVRPSDSSYC